MEYIFGTVRRNGKTRINLKTIGDTHSDLTGSQSITRVFNDAVRTDNFIVEEKYRSDEGADGKCYDWYIVSDYYRYDDMHTAQIGTTEQEITDLEIENIEQGIALTDAEIAIIELQQQIGGN